MNCAGPPRPAPPQKAAFADRFTRSDSLRDKAREGVALTPLGASASSSGPRAPSRTALSRTHPVTVPGGRGRTPLTQDAAVQDVAVARPYRNGRGSTSPTSPVTASSLVDAKRISELEEEVETLKVGLGGLLMISILSLSSCPFSLALGLSASPFPFPLPLPSLTGLLGILYFVARPGGPRTRSSSRSGNFPTPSTRLRTTTAPSSSSKSTSTACW